MTAKKRKKPGVFSVFFLALFLTISAGSAVLAGAWAIWGLPGANASGQVLWPAGGQQPLGAAGANDAPDGAVGLSAGTVNGQSNLPGSSAAADSSGTGLNGTGRYDSLLADEALCREQNIYAKETADPNEVTLVFAGDILFDDHYAPMATMLQRGKGIEGSISADMLQIMRDADIFMLNNEFPYTDRGEPTPDKKFTFRAKPEYVSYLFDMGTDIVSLANNHAFDYGEISLTDTLDTLQNVGMPYVGAGRNVDEAIKPVYFIANDIKIAFIAATQIERMQNPSTPEATAAKPGVFRCLDLTRLLQVVRNAKEVSDYVIVYVHWGTENTDEPDWAQKEQAPKIAEAGADLIIGDHPHVLQGITYCGETPVFYSLGNYLFNSRPLDTCLVQVTLDENGLKSLQFIPGRQEDCTVTKHYGAEKERVLSYIRELSPGVQINAEGYIFKE